MRSVECYTSQEVSRRGEEPYERRIRAQVEPKGRLLVVDVFGGGYALANEELEALERAREIPPRASCA